GAFLAAALGPVAAQREARARRATEASLEQAVDALYGFAVLHGRLPCPDAPDGDGQEDRLGQRACRLRDGALPHADLGVAAQDAWGNRLRYQVTAATALPAASGSNFAAVDDGRCAADGDFDLCASGGISILTRGDDPATAAREGKFARTLANGVPAVVLSHGANGYEARAASGAARARAPARHADERSNADGDAVFMSRVYAAERNACGDTDIEATPLCGFDDLLRWVSPTILAHRMISAGRLP
ncbi:MAG: hypothetical protein ACU85V_09200, partial [Gammaproteobacteria bacterium]